MHGVPLVYLDSANTSQKPQVVLDAMHGLLPAAQRQRGSRGAHPRLGGDRAVRERPGQGGRASSTRRAATRSIFTKNVSESLNLLAYSLSNASTFPGAERFRIGPGDNVVVTEMEHHSNLVPWQLLAQRTGAEFRCIPIDEDGRLVTSAIDERIDERTKVVVLRPPVQRAGHRQPGRGCWWTGRARSVRCPSSTPPSRRRTVRWTCRRSAPTSSVSPGTSCTARPGSACSGAAYELLAELPPFLGGGEMIETVDMTGTTFAAPPHRFEAGTPMIAEAVGLGAAIDYLSARSGWPSIQAHEDELTALRAGPRWPTVPGPDASSARARRIERGATISFTLKGIHPHDVSQLLDEQGIAVRAGHHCARPVCVRYGVPATTRRVLRHLHHDRPRSTRWWPGWLEVRRRCSDERSREERDRDEPVDGFDVPADHPRSLQAPAAPRLS